MRPRGRPPSRRRAPRWSASASRRCRRISRSRRSAWSRAAAAASSAAEGVGIEIVHEMQARAARNAPTPGNAVAGELRERLAAEARSAGAEHDDVGGAGRAAASAAVRMAARSSRRSGSRSSGRLPSACRARSQSSAPRGARAAQSFNAAAQRPPRSDTLRARIVDRLAEWHGPSPHVHSKCIERCARSAKAGMRSFCDDQFEQPPPNRRAAGSSRPWAGPRR